MLTLLILVDGVWSIIEIAADKKLSPLVKAVLSAIILAVIITAITILHL